MVPHPGESPPRPSSLSTPTLSLTAALALLAACAPATQESVDGGVTRTYYVAADEVTWDYAPSGRNLITGGAFTPIEDIWTKAGPDRIGRVYKKAIFREYTDSTFTERKPRPEAWKHLGMLGPVLRAEVGDTIVVVFRNNASFPASLHPHGVFYLKNSEGAPHDDGTEEADKGDDGVAPAGTYTYVWPVPERAGPAEGDLSSILWMYHSHVDEPKDVNTGLMGPMVVTRRGQARSDGSPLDVDRELIVSFHEIDENFSHYLLDNLAAYASRKRTVTMEEMGFFHPFGLSNFMESLNGFVYGNLEGLTVRAGPVVSDGEPQLRGPRPALAREHRGGEQHAHRRGGAAHHGDGRRGHGARQPRNVAVPLPREGAHSGRDDGSLQGHGELTGSAPAASRTLSRQFPGRQRSTRRPPAWSTWGRTTTRRPAGPGRCGDRIPCRDVNPALSR